MCVGRLYCGWTWSFIWQQISWPYPCWFSASTHKPKHSKVTTLTHATIKAESLQSPNLGRNIFKSLSHIIELRFTGNAGCVPLSGMRVFSYYILEERTVISWTTTWEMPKPNKCEYLLVLFKYYRAYGAVWSSASKTWGKAKIIA